MGSPGAVVGVVGDYHFESLQSEIAPVLHFYRAPEDAVHNFISVRLQGDDVPGTLAAIREAWTMVDPDQALPYTFANDRFARLYQAEERLSAATSAFTFRALLIACLGLFGLASLMTTQRVKEIGVRKVLGASVVGITLLLSKDFMRLVIAAFAVAAPVAWWATHRWLEGFAYHVDLGAGVFLLAGALTLCVALVTVSYHAIKAALADPVQSLRYE